MAQIKRIKRVTRVVDSSQPSLMLANLESLPDRTRAACETSMRGPYPGPPLPTDPIREQQAVASVSEAVPRQLDGDHGRATSSQSQSALWIYEAVGHAEMDWSSYGSTDFPS